MTDKVDYLICIVDDTEIRQNYPLHECLEERCVYCDRPIYMTQKQMNAYCEDVIRQGVEYIAFKCAGCHLKQVQGERRIEAMRRAADWRAGWN